MDTTIEDYGYTDLSPYSADGTLGSGRVTYVDSDGELQSIPNTTTNLAEPALWPATEEYVVPVDPPFTAAAEDEFLHEQIHGVPWRGYNEPDTVNPSNPGIPNLGPVNEQPFQSGHTSAIPYNQSAEQGWGLDPAVLLARYPKSENVNPDYSSGIMRRNGQYQFTAADLPFGSFTAENWQLQQASPFRRRSTTHQKLVDNPFPVPWSATVPVGGQAGPLNLIPEGDEAVY